MSVVLKSLFAFFISIILFAGFVFLSPFEPEGFILSNKLLFYLSIFLTLFLLVFFLFNLKPNPIILVRSRIKRLRESLFEHLYVNKTAVERTEWIFELEQRRGEIRSELKYNLKLKPVLEKNIDDIINKSWDELIYVLKSGGVSGSNQVKTADTGEELEALEEIEDIEELETVESPEIEQKKRGLLALAESKLHKDKKKGLLALASLYEGTKAFVREEFDTGKPEEESDALDKIDVVSPFSSMFASLEEDKSAE